MKRLFFISILLLCCRQLQAHEPEEFWWHPYAMDVGYLSRLDVDSLTAALDTMTNPDSIFFARLDLMNQAYIEGEYEKATLYVRYLHRLIEIDELAVTDATYKMLGLRLLDAERLSMRGVSNYTYINEFRRYNTAALNHPVEVGALYYWLKTYLKVIGGFSFDYSQFNQLLQRAYKAALEMEYWEPMGDLLGWMLVKGLITDQEFQRVYKQLPPRPQSYALIYFNYLKQGLPTVYWPFYEMVRLGGPRNVFGTFRGSIELANYFLGVERMDSARYYLDKATEASHFLGDLEVEKHINYVELMYYQIMADTVKVQYLIERNQLFDSLFKQNELTNSALLANNLALDLEESQQALKKRNQWLIGSLAGVSLLLVLFGLQTIRIIGQRKKLRKANDDKVMLYGMIAHDLRSPLAALDNLVQQDTPIDKMRYSVQKYASRLQFLLDDLLKWTFDQRQQLEPLSTSFDVVELLDESISLLELAIDNKQLQLYRDVAEDVPLFADREMIATCVRNMLQNAVKHSTAGSRVYCHCYEEGDCAIVEIRNEGKMTQDKKKSLGLQLIQSFSRMNNCRFTLNEQDGWVVARLTGPSIVSG